MSEATTVRQQTEPIARDAETIAARVLNDEDQENHCVLVQKLRQGDDPMLDLLPDYLDRGYRIDPTYESRTNVKVFKPMAEVLEGRARAEEAQRNVLRQSVDNTTRQMMRERIPGQGAVPEVTQRVNKVRFGQDRYTMDQLADLIEDPANAPFDFSDNGDAKSVSDLTSGGM